METNLNIWVKILIIFLPFLLFTTIAARAESDAQEAIFSMKYLNYSQDFTVYILADSVYIPFDEALTFLKIYYKSDFKGKYIGYVNGQDSSFSVDLNKSEFTGIDGRNVTAPDGSWMTVSSRLYFRTDLFASIFKLSVKMSFNDLAIIIKGNYELPLQRSLKVEFAKENFKKKNLDEAEEFAPLTGKNSFTFLDGGLLDYGITGNKSQTAQSYNFTGLVGLNVLGGELQYNVTGITNGINTDYRQNYRWRYNIGSSVLSSVSLGDLVNMSTRGSGMRGYQKPYYNIRGVQITNELIKMPTRFSEYVIEDRIEPDWNVELYVDNQLYDVQKSDLNGYYRFTVPIRYGMTNICVKLYGPNGEFITTNKLINIPSQLLSPGELRYTLSAGEDYQTQKNVIDGTGYVGLTKWLTNSLSASEIDSSGKPFLMDQISLILFDNIMLNLTATNNGAYEAGLRLGESFIGNWDIYYTSYDQAFSKIGYSSVLSSLNFTNSINGKLLLPFTLSFYGARSMYSGSNSNILNSNLMLNINSINLFLRHNLSFGDRENRIENIGQSASLNCSYYFSNIPDWLLFIGHPRLGVTANFNSKPWTITDCGAILDDQLMDNLVISLNYGVNLIFGTSSFNFSLNLNLPQFRSRSSANYMQGNSISYSSQVNGSLEFDSHNLDLNFTNSIGGNSNYGRGSAAIRIFSDKNNDGKYDDGDELIPEAEVKITSDFVSMRNTGGTILINNLTPGIRYNAKVIQGSMPNVLLIPDMSEFSFVACGYSYTAIDVPCHIGGMIEGTVTRKTESGEFGQGGVKIHLKDINGKIFTVDEVFSDGSFYYNGLPIGEYEAYVDSVQLNILHSISLPKFQTVKIMQKEEGDFVSNVNFELVNFDVVDSLMFDNSGAIASRDGGATKLATENDLYGKLKHQYPDLVGETTQLSFPVIFPIDNDDNETNPESFKLGQIAEYLEYNPDRKIKIIIFCGLDKNKDEVFNRGFIHSKSISNYLSSKKIDDSRVLIGKSLSEAETGDKKIQIILLEK